MAFDRIKSKIRGLLGTGARTDIRDLSIIPPRETVIGQQAVDLATGQMTTVNQGFNDLQQMLQLSNELMQKYRDFEDMDDYGTVSAGLDYYADDATIPDTTTGKTIWTMSQDHVVQALFDDLLHRRLNIEEDIYPITRTTAKYGFNIAEILVCEDGVIGLNYLPPPCVRAIFDESGEIMAYAYDPQAQFSQVTIEEVTRVLADKEGDHLIGQTVIFEPWEVVSWALRSRNMRAVYGESMLSAARWIWKRLTMLEDSAIVYRMSRAPGRFAFYVDTGELPPKEALAYVNQVKSAYRRKRMLNQASGQLDLRFNPLCLAGDTKIPLVDGRVLELKEIVERFGKGEDMAVYSCDVKANTVITHKINWAGSTRKNAILVRVTLDNGQVVRCTPDHHFPLSDGSSVMAIKLMPGDQTMAFRGFQPKVVEVRQDEVREDTFTLTIDDVHTFALEAGIFSENSPHEDFWIPSRGGKDSTRIEVVAGPDYDVQEDLTHYKLELIASLKMPKRWFGYGEDDLTGRAASQDDVRFGRGVMRLQREVRNGLRHVQRVHLAALGIDPDRVEWENEMMIPSYIFELSQIEVRNAEAALANNLEPYFGKKWVMQHVFKLAKGEATTEMAEKDAEKLAAAMADARIQMRVQEAFPQKGAEEPIRESSDGIPMSESAINCIENRLGELDNALKNMTRLERRMETKVDRMAPLVRKTHQRQKAIGGKK